MNNETNESFECADSRFINHVTYNTDTREMSITVHKGGKNTIYTCVDVPKFVFVGFKNAESKGKFFNKNVRGKYQHEYFTDKV